MSHIAVSHYDALELPSYLCATPELPLELLKAAYRKALLAHHPDKVNLRGNISIERPSISVDQITQAYTVLSTPKLRAEYNRSLQLEKSLPKGCDNPDSFLTGVETVDLDDIDNDGEEDSEGFVGWRRSCRCGDIQGFSFRYEDLDQASQAGDNELYVGCRGCSLWLRVLFGVDEEEEEEGVHDA